MCRLHPALRIAVGFIQAHGRFEDARLDSDDAIARDASGNEHELALIYPWHAGEDAIRLARELAARSSTRVAHCKLSTFLINSYQPEGARSELVWIVRPSTLGRFGNEVCLCTQDC